MYIAEINFVLLLKVPLYVSTNILNHLSQALFTRSDWQKNETVFNITSYLTNENEAVKTEHSPRSKYSFIFLVRFRTNSSAISLVR